MFTVFMDNLLFTFFGRIWEHLQEILVFNSKECGFGMVFLSPLESSAAILRLLPVNIRQLSLSLARLDDLVG